MPGRRWWKHKFCLVSLPRTHAFVVWRRLDRGEVIVHSSRGVIFVTIEMTTPVWSLKCEEVRMDAAVLHPVIHSIGLVCIEITVHSRKR